MAGADHLPLRLGPVRQDIGPRPPVPPTPTLNFLTLGRTMTQSALPKRSRGMLLLLNISCRTFAASRSVDSSLYVLAANAGKATSSVRVRVRRQGNIRER